MQKIEVVVGGQYGSEAKGHVTAQLVKAGLADATQAYYNSGGAMEIEVINVRVAGPNAGHTVYDEHGNKFALRQVPVGAAISPKVICYIAPGSEIELSVLLHEIHELRDHGHMPTLFVSGEATLIDDVHKQQEAELIGAIGSTGKGIGAARAARLLRQASRVKDSEEAVRQLEELGVRFIEPVDLYASDERAVEDNLHVIVEGTQGYGLSLRASGHYPQVTSSDCTAIDFLAMAGISPWREGATLNVWVVARAYPIRVAGNSGPLKGETSWEELGLAEERTTVTQKVRRVGEWDGDLVRRAVQANGGFRTVMLALTMADQVIPEIAGFDGTSPEGFKTSAIRQLSDWASGISQEVGAPVGMITTSPTDAAWVLR